MSDRIRSPIEAAADILWAFGATEVYVFGSAASGILREDSDVDLDDESPSVRYLRSSGELVRVR